MTPDEMADIAISAIAHNGRVTLVRPRGQKMPPKFPRGELMCCGSDGQQAYSYDPAKIMSWLKNNGLIKNES